MYSPKACDLFSSSQTNIPATDMGLVGVRFSDNTCYAEIYIQPRNLSNELENEIIMYI